VVPSAVLVFLAARSANRRSAELTEALERAESRADELADRLAQLEQRADGPQVHEGVVMQLEDRPVEGTVAAERIDGRLFADIVAREAVVKAASWTHGVRRALAPEVRNRIRFEMRREVKRARKQRRADLKAALRDLQARERAAMRAERDEGDAA
jgi:hypothetical protein